MPSDNTSTPDGWEDVEYTCRECGDTHHPSERKEHEFRADVTVCPNCESTRFRITHDLDGPVPNDTPT